jgi:ligand-binding sensor domain-containing protein
MEDREGRVWCATRGAGIFVRNHNRWQLFSDLRSLSEFQAASLFEDEDSVVWIGMDGAGLNQVRQRNIVALEPPADIPPTCFWSVCAGHDGAIWGGPDGAGIFRWKDGLFTHFSNDQGLADEHVNAILEDSQFNIWAGTMGGLFRLDGDHFQAISDPKTLSLPVFALLEDHAGSLWAGTRNGLVQINGAMTHVFGQAEGIPFGGINAIEEAANGTIWLSIPPSGHSPGPTGPHGLFMKSGDRFTHRGGPMGR